MFHLIRINRKNKITPINILCLVLFCVLYFFNTSYSQEKTISNSLKLRDTISKKGKKKDLLKYNGKDGPYIVGDTLYRVNHQNQLVMANSHGIDSVLVRVDNRYDDQFNVALQSKYEFPKTHYDMPSKLVVISDIEGQYNAFSSFLISNGIMDTNHNWTFDNGHLVLVGDFVDRGKNVTQVLWLIYKLEFQAKKRGGVVHFILGNHEVLNFQGNHKYNRKKYIKVAQDISGKKDKKKAIKYMYSTKTELGKWLATKNVVEQIGKYLFVHGGFSSDLLKYKLSLHDINNKTRLNYYSQNLESDSTINFLYSPKGPFWYRGYFMNRLNYLKIKIEALDRVLSYYTIDKIVVGHTPVDTIAMSFNGKVIGTDVSHGKDKYSGKTKGLLIEHGKEFTIDDLGAKIPLKL